MSCPVIGLSSTCSYMLSPPSVTEGGGGGSWVFSYSGAVVTAAGAPGSVVHCESVPAVI